ncbi:MAG: hypothetical protein GF364_21395 [Candidatus Lokiarchaeota archaeon]|nr:hypothetical protein [Candidatus Lokiarchaeota archaeon]
MNTNNNPRKLYKISQIDAIKGIQTPHENDLRDLGKKSIGILRDLDLKRSEEIASKIGGYIDDLDFGEEWTITKQIFPKANIHFLYQYYGDEFGDGEEDEI